MTSKAYVECVYGLGGSMLDPAGGMATLLAKVKALGVRGAAMPWDQSNIQAVIDAVNQHPDDALNFVIGDSCGANKAPLVAAAVHPRKIHYMACIQASIYCQAGCPDIPANVERALIIYSDYAHTGGLGCYVARPAVLPASPKLVDGWHVGNNGKTLYKQVYVPAAHPDDGDVLRVQDPIIADIRAILAAHT